MSINPDLTINYNEWYVLQVKVNREYYIKNIIEYQFRNKYRLFIFAKEILHLTNGKTIKLTVPLFPGYIFFFKKVNEFIKVIKKKYINEFIKPISFNGVPATVHANEMRLLFSSCNENGIFKLSKGYILDDGRVRIIRGPLKNIEGKIIFINKKKRRAKVCLSLFNRKIYVSMGLDFINSVKTPETSVTVQQYVLDSS